MTNTGTPAVVHTTCKLCPLEVEVWMDRPDVGTDRGGNTHCSRGPLHVPELSHVELGVPGTVTVRMAVEITVPVEAWALTYGLRDVDVEDDVVGYYLEHVGPALRGALGSVAEVGGEITIKQL